MRGGKRPGAGSKLTDPTQGRRVTFTCRVSPVTRGKISELREQGVNIGTLFDKWVSGYATAKFLRDFEKEFGGER